VAGKVMVMTRLFPLPARWVTVAAFTPL
jgi:hypothetical protein